MRSLSQRIDEARTRVATALAARDAAALEVEQADDAISEADLTVLTETFDAANAEHTAAQAQLASLERVAEARALTAVEDPEAPAPEERANGDRPRITVRDRDDVVSFVEVRGANGATRRTARVNDEPLMYERDGERSFFADLVFERTSYQARERLQRHMREAEAVHRELVRMGERRDITSTDGSGGNFIPPLWMQDEWLALARAGRPFANLARQLGLPERTDSINIPRVSTGTAAAIQTADNAAVQETDMTDGSISVPVRTIAGQQDIARQALERSFPGLDEVIFMDLGADYSTKLDVQTLNGSGSSGQAKGVLQDANVIAVAYTDASPTVAELYAKLADAIQQVHTNRFLSPEVIAMHPRRWGWFLAALDTTNRPLVLPAAGQGGILNAAGILERVGAENLVGQLHGLPVVVDASIPTTLGAGTNEDAIIVTRASDLWLFEDGVPNQATYESVGSGNLTIRLQIWGYFAFTTERYSKASAKITGTGLAAPTF